MMHGHGKSDFAIVAVKPANNAEPLAVEQSTTWATVAESVEPRAKTERFRTIPYTPYERELLHS
jgi:hypothetical protein